MSPVQAILWYVYFGVMAGVVTFMLFMIWRSLWKEERRRYSSQK